MAVIETWLNQDLQQPVKVHHIDGSFFSHNGNGNRIGVHVFNNGQPVTLEGTVSGYVVISDGTTVPCVGYRRGHNATILIPPAAYTPGAVLATIFLTSGNTVTTLAAVAASVVQARTNTQVDPGSVITDWTTIINEAMQAVYDFILAQDDQPVQVENRIWIDTDTTEETQVPTYEETLPAIDFADGNVSEWGDETYITAHTQLYKASGVKAYPGNLVVPSECVNNAYVRYGSGTIATNESNYFATGYIPVSASTEYRANAGRNFAWYNSGKTYISGESGTGIQTGITSPASAAYIRFTINKTEDDMSDPYGLYFAPAASFDKSVIIRDLVAGNATWCYGKRISWIGDSIVAGSDFDEVVSQVLGLQETDYGINGSTIALSESGSDTRNAICARYSSMTNDADIIAVSGGTNDFEYSWCPIGDITSTSNNTFYGALKNLCAGLIAKYPNKVIFFTTPIKRAQPFESGNGGTYTPDGTTLTPWSKNKYGKTLQDYADIIKEVCGYYSIPVLDLYRESGLNPHITAQQVYFDSALTHPNATGQKIMARRVAGWMTQLAYTIPGLT